MAKVTITIEDRKDGTVSFVSSPDFSTMMKMHQSGNTLTSAHGIAIASMNAMLREKKLQQNKSRVVIPRLA